MHKTPIPIAVLLACVWLAAAPAAAAPIPTTFTLDPSKITPALTGAAGPFTADHAVMTDYVFAHQAVSDNVPFPASYVFAINGFTLKGAPVSVPGLGSSFGLYFAVQEVDHSAAGASIAESGSVQLRLDPTNNDGAPSTTLANGITFANPAGTADDITLATGQLLQSTFAVTNGIATKYQLFSFSPTAGEGGFFVSPGANTFTELELFNTNTSTSRQFLLQPDGSFVTVVNAAIGSADLLVPEPASAALFATAMLGLLALRRHAQAR